MFATLIITSIILIKTVNSIKPSAHEVLHQMAQTYASCKTYQDIGTVTDTYNASKGNSWNSTTHFRTAFARPLHFRFEFISGDNRLGDNTHYIMWTSNDQVYTWWTVEPKVKKEESISLAIAGATGISSGSAHTVPRLLLPNKVSGWVLTNLQNPSLMLTETVDSRVCYKIDSHDRGRMVSVWIDKQNHLIRKIVETTPDIDVISTTIYKPKLNKDIPVKAFESGLPKSSN